MALGRLLGHIPGGEKTASNPLLPDDTLFSINLFILPESGFVPLNTVCKYLNISAFASQDDLLP